MTFTFDQKSGKWKCGKRSVTTTQLVEIATRSPSFRIDRRTATT